jgi:N utilization substance protein B
MASQRRLVRIKALEVLYAYQIAKEHLDKVKKDLLVDLTDIDKYVFASDLIDAVLEHQRALDLAIRTKIKNWEYERVSLLDKIIIRIAIAELMFFPEIPPKVSINEAIELAKQYCTRKSPKFINGVLDAILNDLRKENKLNKTGRGLIEFNKPEDEK